MRALDTNVLVRYLAQDDARQSALATRLLEEQLSGAERGFVSLVVVLETVWVMEGRYDADATMVSDILDDLLQAPTLEVQEASAVRDAVQRYRQGGVSTCTTASSSRWRPLARPPC